MPIILVGLATAVNEWFNYRTAGKAVVADSSATPAYTDTTVTNGATYYQSLRKFAQ